MTQISKKLQSYSPSSCKSQGSAKSLRIQTLFYPMLSAEDSLWDRFVGINITQIGLFGTEQFLSTHTHTVTHKGTSRVVIQICI